MKKNILSALCSIFIFCTYAQNVTKSEAINVAYKQLFGNINTYRSNSISVQDTIAIKDSSSGNILFYVINFEDNKGYVIVSGNKNIKPILAYVKKGNYDEDNCAPQLSYFISSYKEELKSVPETFINKQNQKEWENLNSGNTLKKRSGYVAPLIKTIWGQSEFYNNSCPPCLKGNAVVGCVALSLAQVMHYYKWPDIGVGNKTYKSKYFGTISAQFDSYYYDWDSYPVKAEEYNGNFTDFLYQCGVAVDMTYGCSESTTYPKYIPNALEKYFKYAESGILITRAEYADTVYIQILKNELDAGRPILFSGNPPSSIGSIGHQFILDGYDGDLFSVNFGWNGEYNGFYSLNVLPDDYVGYNINQKAIIGIHPHLATKIDKSRVIPINIGTVYNGTTIDGINEINSYRNTTIEYAENGKEQIHSVEITENSRLYVSLLSEDNISADVFLLNSLSRDSVIAYGDFSIISEELSPGTYYIVVDGRHLYEGAYSLTTHILMDSVDLLAINLERTNSGAIFSDASLSLRLRFENEGFSHDFTNTLGIYLSEKDYFDNSALFLDSLKINTDHLKEQDSIDFEVFIPHHKFGYYYVYVRMDESNSIFEENEENNITSYYFVANNPYKTPCNVASKINTKYTTIAFAYDDTSAYNRYYPYEIDSVNGPERVYKYTSPDSGFVHINLNNYVINDCFTANFTILLLSDCDSLKTLAFDRFSTQYNNEIIYPVVPDVTYFIVVEANIDVIGTGTDCEDPQYLFNEIINATLEVVFQYPCETPEIQITTTGCSYASLSVENKYNSYIWSKNGEVLSNETSYKIYYLYESGNYTVEVSDNYGCKRTSDTAFVEIFERPTTPSIKAFGIENFCKDSVVVLVAEMDEKYDILWKKNYDTIFGANSDTLIVTEEGQYTVYSILGNCFNTSNIYISKHKNPENYSLSTDSLFCFYDLSDTSKTSSDFLNENNKSWTDTVRLVEDRHGNKYGARYMNGDDDFFAPRANYKNYSTFTVSLWIKTNSSTGGNIISYGKSYMAAKLADDVLIYMDDDGKIYFQMNYYTPITINTQNTYNNSTWHMITVTCAISKYINMYVDGNLVASDSSGKSYSGCINCNWGIGNLMSKKAIVTPTAQSYKGAIDEVAIYYRAIDEKEVLALYNFGKVIPEIKNVGICEGEDIEIKINHPQAFVDYQFYSGNNAISDIISSSGGDTLNFIIPNILNDTSIYLKAINQISSCPLIIGDTIDIKTFKTFIPTVSIESNAINNKFYKNEIPQFSLVENIIPGNIKIEWKRNGIVEEIDSEIFIPYSLNNGDTIYAEIRTDAPCAESSKVISNKIIVSYNPSLSRQKLHLDKGWNLVSLFVNPSNGNALSVFPNAEIIKCFNEFYSSNQPLNFCTLYEIKGGDAYFVFNSKSEELEIIGEPLKSPYIKKLDKGWNLIGVPCQKMLDLSFLPKNTEILKNFDGYYIPKNWLKSIDTLIPGKGYIIKVNESIDIEWKF